MFLFLFLVYHQQLGLSNFSSKKMCWEILYKYKKVEMNITCLPPSLREKVVPIPLQSYVLLASPPRVAPPPPRGSHCLILGTLIPFNIFLLLLRAWITHIERIVSSAFYRSEPPIYYYSTTCFYLFSISSARSFMSMCVVLM